MSIALDLFSENCIVGNSIFCGVVHFEICCILWVSHFLESFSRYSGSFGIEKMTPYSASATEENTYFRTVEWHSRGVAFERVVHWECVVLPRKK
jgi:hypothetical protein